MQGKPSLGVAKNNEIGVGFDIRGNNYTRTSTASSSNHVEVGRQPPQSTSALILGSSFVLHRQKCIIHSR